MPSIVWCARTPYRVNEDPKKVIEQIGNPLRSGDQRFVLLTRVGSGRGVALTIDHISALEELPQAEIEADERERAEMHAAVAPLR